MNDNRTSNKAGYIGGTSRVLDDVQAIKFLRMFGFTDDGIEEWLNTLREDMRMAIFEVIVGNIGTVYSGNNYMQASCTFTTYVKASKAGGGRAAGENVTLMHNGDIRKEYLGPMNDVE